MAKKCGCSCGGLLNLSRQCFGGVARLNNGIKRVFCRRKSSAIGAKCNIDKSVELCDYHIKYDENTKRDGKDSDSLDSWKLAPLDGISEILDEDHRINLCVHLPIHMKGRQWKLVINTNENGYSLKNLYRQMADIDGPILLVVKDMKGHVFGALTSSSFRISEHFYGTGESFLFTFVPEFQVFHWTYNNPYFIKGSHESLIIGDGDGRFGLILDSNLDRGKTQSCSTYGNQPLAPLEDFRVKILECWTFQ